jgi:hypothetical protein
MKKIYPFCLLAFALALMEMSLSAQNVIRGPYLQSPGPSSIILRWRTDSLTDSRVYYGTTIGSMTFHADSTTLTTEHRVKLNGLSPKTKYYYLIGNAALVLRGPSEAMNFVTAPDPSVPGPVRLWAIGDFGHGSTEQRDVRDAYLSYTANHPADLQLWLGDDAYSHGTDQEYQDKVFDTVNCYGNIFLHTPFIPAPGNHDWDGVCAWASPCNTDPNLQTGPYLNLVDPPTEGEQGGVPSHTKLFYSFDYGDIHFISLNSELGAPLTPAYNWVGVFDNSTTFTSPMIDWLKADLAATTKKWKIAIWHQCPYSGQDDFTEAGTLQYFTYATRAHFNPHLEQYGVDLVLTGHDHNYQRSYLVNGLYGFKAQFNPFMIIDGSSGNGDAGHAYVKYTDGPQPNRGTVYVVEGNSSENNGGGGTSTFSHPYMYKGDTCGTCFGSLIVDIDGDRLDGYYLTAYDSVQDHFTILKQSSLGIKEPSKALDDFKVVPNPFNWQCDATYTLSNRASVKIDVLDIKGRVVSSIAEATREPGSYRDKLSLEKLAAGTYTVRLECGGAATYQKIIKTQ